MTIENGAAEAEVEHEIVLGEESLAIKPDDDAGEQTPAVASPPLAPEADAAAELQRQLAEERARRERAERGIRSVQEQAAYDQIVNGLAAVEQEAAGLAREYQEALEGADYAKATELQRKIARAENRLEQFEQGKAGWEARFEAQRRAPAQEPITDGDKIEQFVSQFSPRSQDYLRKHKECITDKALNAKLVQAHHHAIGEGLSPDSEEYFAHLDARMGFGAKAPPRRAPLTAAPVTRESGMASSQSLAGTKVKLTAAEVRSATDGTLVWNTGPNKGKPIGTQEMARRKHLMSADDGQYVS